MTHPSQFRLGDGKSALRFGFTLVELLVVVAVVAILVAILLPVFLSARAKARESVCLSNCRQLWHATQQYADDYDWRGPGMPLWGDDTFGSDMRASPLWRYVRSRAVAMCPSDPRTPDPQTGRRRQWSITYNGALLNLPPVPFRSCDDGSGALYSNFNSARRMPMWICECTDPRECGYPEEYVCRDTIFIWFDLASSAHGGSALISFLDGHAGRLRGSRRWGSEEGGVFRINPTFCPSKP